MIALLAITWEKVNIVADTLSRKVTRLMVKEWKLLENACEWIYYKWLTFDNIVIQLSQLAQEQDSILRNCQERAQKKELSDLSIKPKWVLKFQSRIYMPTDDDLKVKISFWS